MTESNLVSLPTPTKEINEGILQAIEELLESAKAGNVTALVFASMEHGESTPVFRTFHSKTDNILEQIGLARALQFEIESSEVRQRLSEGGL